MSEDAYVFLGPSLPAEVARDLVPARFLPPVTQGDVCALVLDREPPRAIGIVDGQFEQVPAVWHKEILFAISSGTTVFGASSLGALRAAELHAFGMIGVGEIFDAYRTGVLTDDDEVAIVHATAEDGFRPLSIAMVSLRFGVAEAVRAAVLAEKPAAALLAEVKSWHYPNRSWEALFLAGADLGVSTTDIEALRAFVAARRPDAKRSDAVLMLTRMRQYLESTYYWEKLCRTVRNDRHVTQTVSTHEALLRNLARREAIRLGVVLDDEPLVDSDEIINVLTRRYLRELEC
jgi:hypothetical protein